MRVLRDYCGVAIRLTDERRSHILEHPEMTGLEWAIDETLANPEIVSESPADETARLYYRYYVGTRVGDKFLCVVVKMEPDDAFVLTAYLTDRPKRGRLIWSATL